MSEVSNAQKRHFNVTGLCTPAQDYMVDITSKLSGIKEMIDAGEYFTINRARQYGKTTTLHALKQYLKDDYIVVKISFEGLGGQFFADEASFCSGFARIFEKALRFSSASKEDIQCWNDIADVNNFLELSGKITDFCQGRRVVLLIDEVDKATDNQTFLHFLGMLREKYLSRKAGEDFTFTSVILAGVYDVKNIKLRMQEKGYAVIQEGETKYNSPWNTRESNEENGCLHTFDECTRDHREHALYDIASSFEIDMAFSPVEIATMLREYEADHHTNMDIEEIASEIWNYTSGYPFLVSRICQELDETDKPWNVHGVQAAVKAILLEKNTLFDDIAHNLENNETLFSFMYELLILGQEKHFERTNSTIDLAATYGFIRNDDGKAVVDNRMFEIKIANYFISKNLEKKDNVKIGGVLTEDVIRDGHFRMDYVLEKFASHYAELYENEKNRKFLEEKGRLLFLTYLRPLINGKGFYHIESQTSTERRMDIVVDYGNDQFVLELKLWYGAKKHEEAYRQLWEYLESTHRQEGYLLTFDFRKQKKPVYQWVTYQGKRILDVVV